MEVVRSVWRGQEQMSSVLKGMPEEKPGCAIHAGARRGANECTDWPWVISNGSCSKNAPSNRGCEQGGGASGKQNRDCERALGGLGREALRRGLRD